MTNCSNELMFWTQNWRLRSKSCVRDTIQNGSPFWMPLIRRKDGYRKIFNFFCDGLSCSIGPLSDVMLLVFCWVSVVPVVLRLVVSSVDKVSLALVRLGQAIVIRKSHWHGPFLSWNVNPLYLTCTSVCNWFDKL